MRKYWMALIAAVGLGAHVAHAAPVPLDLSAAKWTGYAGAGSLSNVMRDVPDLGTVNVLQAGTAEGTHFGFVQKSYWAQPQLDARFMGVTFRAATPFLLYVRVRGQDGVDYYLTYMTNADFAQAQYGSTKYAHVAHGSRGTGGQWVTFWADLQSDLAATYPGVQIAFVRWVALRGDMEIAAITFDSELPHPIDGDFDGDLVVNGDEMGTQVWDGSGVVWVSSNPFRADSDGDGVHDFAEFSYPGCADSLLRTKPTLDDAIRNGVSDRDAILLLSNCAEAFAPWLHPNGWRIYADPGDAQIEVTTTAEYSTIVTMTHSDPNPLAMGMMNSSALPPYPPLAIERDQFFVSFKPNDLTEKFSFYVLVEASNGNRYYLFFPRGTGSIGFAQWGAVTYLRIPLEETYGYDFSVLPLQGEFVVYVNLSDALGLLLPGVHVKNILWVTARGRLTITNVLFGPLPIFPVPDFMTAGQSIPLNAHDPNLNWYWMAGLPTTNLGALCRYNENACDSYLWTSFAGSSSLSFSISATDQVETWITAPMVTFPDYYDIRLRATQATPQRPDGILTGIVQSIYVTP